MRRSLFTIVVVVVIALFVGVPNAYADDCSSASDCANVVRGTGLLSALLGVLIGTAAAATKKKWEVKKEKKKFKDCKEAGEWIRDTANRGGETAHTDIDLKHKYVNKKVTQQDDGSYVAEGELQSQLDPNNSITLPEWTNAPNKAELQAWKSYVEKVEVHERGHVTIAEEYEKEQLSTNEKVSSDPADSREKAIKDLGDKLGEKAKERQKALQDRSDEYDDVTHHGETQSRGPQKGFPGGEDARLECP